VISTKTTTKLCSRCRQERPVAEFRLKRSDRPWLRSHCRACESDRARKWYQVNRGHAISRSSAWHSKNRSRSSENQRKWRAKNRALVRQLGVEQRRKRKYGVTPEMYDAMIAASGGLCAICRKPASLSIDHDHSTGLVRDLLCRGCNTGLGGFKDDPSALQAAIAYLHKHGKQQGGGQ